ncbi:MAG: DUF5681 domain-containing protein, partial [Pseudomonadales bacterium]
MQPHGGRYLRSWLWPSTHAQPVQARSVWQSSGPPEGLKNFKTDLLEVLKMPVQIGENGRKRKISSQRAGLLRLREKALAGDARALDRLLEFARNYNDEDEGSSQLVRSSSDESILANLEARFRRRLEQGGDDDAS